MRTLVLAAILLLARPGVGVRSAPAEVARIRRHLARVEAQLRATDVSVLTAAQRAARARNLDVLHEYWVRGVFPVNTDFPGRHVPYFVDRFGTRCAMAYLIEQSGAVDFVHRIATTANNAYIRELKDDAELGAWLHANGLTAAEAARIQPTYGSPADDFAGTWDGTVSFGSDGTRMRFILSHEGRDNQWMLVFPAQGGMVLDAATVEADSIVFNAGYVPSVVSGPQPVKQLHIVLHYGGNSLTGIMELHYVSGAVVRGTVGATLQCQGHDSPAAVVAFVRRLRLPKVRCTTEIGAGATPAGEWSVHQVIYRNLGEQYRNASRTALLWGNRVGWIAGNTEATDSAAGIFRARPGDTSLTSPAFLRGMAALGMRVRWTHTLLADPTVPRVIVVDLISALRDSLDVPLAELLAASPRVTRDPELLVTLVHIPVVAANAAYRHARDIADQALWAQSLALIAAPGTSHDVLLTLATWRDRHGKSSCPGRPTLHDVIPALEARATRENDRSILDALGTVPHRPGAPSEVLIC